MDLGAKKLVITINFTLHRTEWWIILEIKRKPVKILQKQVFLAILQLTAAAGF